LILDQLIDFRINKGANVTYQKKIPFIKINQQQLIIPKVMPIKHKQVSNAIKYLIKQLYQDSIGEFGNYHQQLKFVAELYIKSHNLYEWCTKKNIRK
jgi:hypothetical protein